MRTIDDDFLSYMALAGAVGMSFDHWGGSRCPTKAPTMC
jgi:hypothetical protein